MPATVRLSDPTRTTLRALIVIAALIALLVPVAVTVAHGASRLGYERIEMQKPLPTGASLLRFDIDIDAAIRVTTAETAEPSVTFTATGPRDARPRLDIGHRDEAATVTVDSRRGFENARIEVTLPKRDSKSTTLDITSGFGAVFIDGDYEEVRAATDGGAVNIDGSAERVRTSTDWGATSLRGTFGSIEAQTDVGSFDGTDLTVKDQVDVVTDTGRVDLDFSNDAVPAGGISAKTSEGTIDLQLPRLDIAEQRMGIDELSYRINAKSANGTVDLASDLEEYDVSQSPSGEGTTVIPVSAHADTGMITISQN